MLHRPVVPAGAYDGRSNPWTPRLDTATVRQTSIDPQRFTADADGESVTPLPIARVHHRHHDVYCLTDQPPCPPPEFAAWCRFGETTGTTAAATGSGKTVRLAGKAAWTAGHTGGAVALDGTAFLTPRRDAGTLRYAITAGGGGAERRIDADPLTTGR